MHAPNGTITPRPAPTRSPARSAWLALSLAAVAALLVACSEATEVGQTAQAVTGMQVLGLYEFEFTDIGTPAMTATVRRVDDDGVARQALGTSPLTGISVSLVTSGTATSGGNVQPEPGRTYIWAEFEVVNNRGEDLAGLTFMGYSSAGTATSIDGTAFTVVEGAAARAIYPGGVFQGSGGPPPQRAVLDTNAGFRMSVVAYSEDEIQPLNDALRTNFSFVNTVFPYGFAATSAIDSDSSRTIVEDGSGRLLMGFNAAGLTRVVWRGVAVIDDSVRIASPRIYNYRDKVDGFAQFLTLSQGLRTNNGLGAGDVEVVVLGQMVQGTRALPVGYTCDSFAFVELGDVRIAGGYTGSDAHYWIGGATGANTAVTKVTDGSGDCVGP